jgi:hypothetical protein
VNYGRKDEYIKNKNMQNIGRLNYFCKDGENRKNWFILTLRFGGDHHHQACCSLIVLKRRVYL